MVARSELSAAGDGGREPTMVIRAATLADAAEIARRPPSSVIRLRPSHGRAPGYLLASPRHTVLWRSRRRPAARMIALEQRVLLEYDERVEIVGLWSMPASAAAASASRWSAPRTLGRGARHRRDVRSFQCAARILASVLCGLGYTRSKTQHAYRRRLPVAGLDYGAA